MKDQNELQGLGGWLILVGFGVVFGPIRLVYEFGPLYYGIFTDGSFEYLTTPGTDLYHPLWGPLLIFELVFNTLVLLVSIFMIFLFFSKHYLFPWFYVAVTLVMVVFIPFDAWLGSFVLTDEPMFDPATAGEFGRAIGAIVIWVPYMFLSKRVKATFVESRPGDDRQREIDAGDGGLSA